MRESVHELNRIPTEYHEDGAPELPELPDEFNRFPRKAKAKEDRSRLRKVMLYLAVAGLVTLGVFAPLHPDNRPAEAEAVQTTETEPPAKTPEASALPTVDPTPAHTPEPTPDPTAEPTPEPTPGVDVLFYRTSQVYSAALQLYVPERIADVTFRFRHSLSGDVAFEVKLTPDEIASGAYVSDPFDANRFLFEHWPENTDTYAEPEVTMETLFTVRTDNGDEVFEIESIAEVEPWVNVNYDSEEDVGGIVEMMYGTVYPDCFVVRIEEAKTFPLRVVFGDDPEVLDNGDVLITISADGEVLTGEFDLTAVYFDEYDGEREFYIVIAVPRPENFPEHGTVEIVMRQKLTDHDYIHVRTKTITY